MPRPDIEAIHDRAEAATDGPWFVEQYGDFGDKRSHIAAVLREQYGANALDFGEDMPTAEFVAHARTDIPQLLAYIAELEDRLTTVFLSGALHLGMTSETVGDRKEVVIYTGWTDNDQGVRPMTDDEAAR